MRARIETGTHPALVSKGQEEVEIGRTPLDGINEELNKILTGSQKEGSDSAQVSRVEELSVPLSLVYAHANRFGSVQNVDMKALAVGRVRARFERMCQVRAGYSIQDERDDWPSKGGRLKSA
jgi:hypothetical protein